MCAWTLIEPLYSKFPLEKLYTQNFHKLHDSIIYVSCNLNINGKKVKYPNKILVNGQKDRHSMYICSWTTFLMTRSWKYDTWVTNIVHGWPHVWTFRGCEVHRDDVYLFLVRNLKGTLGTLNSYHSYFLEIGFRIKDILGTHHFVKLYTSTLRLINDKFKLTHPSSFSPLNIFLARLS